MILSLCWGGGGGGGGIIMYFAIWGNSLGTSQGILNQYRDVFRTSRVSLSRKIRPGMQHGTIGQHSNQ